MLRRTVTVPGGASVTADAVLALALNADVLVTASTTFPNLADIENPEDNLVGIAGAASQAAVTSAQIESRPTMRAGEVLETIPGLIVSQHSGEGKANQYYLRGFNLDHGTDFSTTVAGVPGAHTHRRSRARLRRRQFLDPRAGQRSAVHEGAPCTIRIGVQLSF